MDQACSHVTSLEQPNDTMPDTTQHKPLQSCGGDRVRWTMAERGTHPRESSRRKGESVLVCLCGEEALPVSGAESTEVDTIAQSEGSKVESRFTIELHLFYFVKQERKCVPFTAAGNVT